MAIQKLINEREEFKNKIQSQLYIDYEIIKQQAEDMAEAATCIQGQGYQNFIRARETFLNTIGSIQQEYCKLFMST